MVHQFSVSRTFVADQYRRCRSRAVYRWLWMRCVVRLASTRVSLSLRPANDPSLGASAMRGLREPSSRADWRRVLEDCHAVRTAGQWVVHADRPCLPLAVVTQRLLAEHGFLSRLKFGVFRDSTNGLCGHAWVECGGRVVIGRVAQELIELERCNGVPGE